MNDGVTEKDSTGQLLDSGLGVQGCWAGKSTQLVSEALDVICVNLRFQEKLLVLITSSPYRKPTQVDEMKI